MTGDEIRNEIARRTGLLFCDEDCPCGENNQLWWTVPGEIRDDLPEWANGSTTEDWVEELGLEL